MRANHAVAVAVADTGIHSALTDVEVVLAFSRELRPVTSVAALCEALGGALKPVLPSRDLAVLRSVHNRWEVLFGPEDATERLTQYAWTPLTAEGRTIGMLGLGSPAIDGPSGRLADAILSILATAIQNVIVLENLRQDSVRDGLTGCFNRGHAIEMLEGNLRRANRTGFPVSMLMIDVDGFKQINDGFGHVAGDAVLAKVAEQLHTMLRRSDIRCRIGGDEFLVILPDTLLGDAMRVGESIRKAIAGMTIPSPRGEVTITASIGVATAACSAPVDVPGFIDRADVALYRAKQAGRNRVHACNSSSSRVRASLRLATRVAQ